MRKSLVALILALSSCFSQQYKCPDGEVSSEQRERFKDNLMKIRRDIALTSSIK